MIQSISNYDFHNAFKLRGRENQFSYEALNLLFDYFESIEDEANQIELDVISICCDFSEDHYKDIFNSYDIICDSESPSDEEVKQTVIDYLEDNTSFIGESIDGKLVFQQF